MSSSSIGLVGPVPPPLPRARAGGRPRRGRLSARLFAIQVGGSGQYTALAATTRTVLEPCRRLEAWSSIEAGGPSSTNVASYSVRIRPVDLPESKRDEVVHTLGALIGIDPAEINAAIDSNPARATTACAWPRTSIRRWRASSRRPRTTCRGSTWSSNAAPVHDGLPVRPHPGLHGPRERR